MGFVASLPDFIRFEPIKEAYRANDEMVVYKAYHSVKMGWSGFDYEVY